MTPTGNKSIFLTLLFVCLALFGIAQPPDTLSSDRYSIEPDREAKLAVSKIVQYTGLSPNFIIVESDIPTAIAYIKDNKRYIGYNPDFILKVRNRSKTDWAAVSVLAHEIGHHLSGHTLKGKRGSPGDELAADKFSGFILQHMGATLEETQAALQAIGHEMDESKHPPKDARLESITNGWNEAEGLTNTVAFEERPAKSKKTRITFTFKCRFFGDDNLYFVDALNRIIWYDNFGNAIVIGKKSPSEVRRYDWVYSYSDEQYFVDFKGNIWAETNYGSAFKVGVFEAIR